MKQKTNQLATYGFLGLQLVGLLNSHNIGRFIGEKILSNPKQEAVSKQIDTEKQEQVYSQEDKELVTNILYSEAATEPNARKAIARVILNRVESDKYPSTVKDVIFQKNAFACIGKRNWKQATRQLKRNAYEERVYQECKQDAEDILNGEKLGLNYENKIISFDDIRTKKPKDKYWNSLEKITQIDDMVFYKEKRIK